MQILYRATFCVETSAGSVQFYWHLFAIIATVGVAEATADGVAAATASDMHAIASGSVATLSPAVSAVSSQCNGTISTRSNVQVPAEAVNEVILSKDSSYLSILKQLCAELSLDPPTIEISKKSTGNIAMLSLRYGFPSSKLHAKKADAQEDAARVALSALKGDVTGDKNCRAQLNEYCQEQQCGKPEYAQSGSGPFNCTVFVAIVHSSLSLPTEDEATNDAARGILSTLGHTQHVLQMFDDPRFETFTVSCSAPSVFTLTARYRFAARLDAGQRSKKAAEKVAAQHALSLLSPDLDPKPDLVQCKNKLQELYIEEPPKYVTTTGSDGLYFSEVSVSFSEQMNSDNLSSLDASNNLAKCALKHIHLIS